MSNNATPIELLLEDAADYGKTTLELVKLQAVATCADVVSVLFQPLEQKHAENPYRTTQP